MHMWMCAHKRTVSDGIWNLLLVPCPISILFRKWKYFHSRLLEIIGPTPDVPQFYHLYPGNWTAVLLLLCSIVVVSSSIVPFWFKLNSSLLYRLLKKISSSDKHVFLIPPYTYILYLFLLRYHMPSINWVAYWNITYLYGLIHGIGSFLEKTNMKVLVSRKQMNYYINCMSTVIVEHIFNVFNQLYSFNWFIWLPPLTMQLWVVNKG